MQFDLSRWRGLNTSRLGRFAKEFPPSDAVEVLHHLGDGHLARDLLREMNADDESRKPMWTLAESAAWDVRSHFAQGTLGASLIGTVPGRALCLQLAHSDIGYYLTSYALQDNLPLLEALKSMRTAGGEALAWGVLSSARTYVELIARDERLESFVASLLSGEEDHLYGLPDDGFDLDALVASGFIQRLATDFDPGLLHDFPSSRAVVELEDGLTFLVGGAEATAVVAQVLKDRATQPRTRSDEIYSSSLAGAEPAAVTASVLLGAVLSQLAAIPAGIALAVAVETQTESPLAAEPVEAGTVFGLLEDLIAELGRIVYLERESTLHALERLAEERDIALDASSWALAELERLRSLHDSLGAERDLLGEQLKAEQRRRHLETGALRAEIDDLVRQQGLDNQVIRDLNAFIDSRQRRRLREALRDVVAGASLGGTVYGSAGALAGGILGLLGAAADERRNP